MNTDEPFKTKIKHYTVRDLEKMTRDISSEEYPERHELVSEELAERMKAGEHEKSLFIPFHIGRSIWWAFVWRSTLLTIIIEFLVGIPLGLFKSAMQLPDPVWNIIKMMVTWAIYIFVGIATISHVLTKSFREFRVSIIERKPNNKSIDAHD